MEVSIQHLLTAIIDEDDIMIIDVREGPELEGPLGRIPTAFHIPMKNFQEPQIRKVITHILRRNPQKLILICAHGNSSYEAAQTLIRNNLQNARSVAGGMLAYQKYIRQNIYNYGKRSRS